MMPAMQGESFFAMLLFGDEELHPRSLSGHAANQFQKVDIVFLELCLHNLLESLLVEGDVILHLFELFCVKPGREFCQREFHV